MRSATVEDRQQRECPEYVAESLLVAGGANPFGGPMFRIVWGWNRIVSVHGQWEQWAAYRSTLRDKLTGYRESRDFMKLESTVIETRQVPKYLPANCWHLEMWRPAEEYGSPEDWKKLGEEALQGMTLDTSGPYPERGEYELVFPLTTDGTSRGEPIPLVEDAVTEIVSMLCRGRGALTFQQRKAAIEQRILKEEEGLVQRLCDMMKDGMKPFAGEDFVTVPALLGPDGKTVNNEPKEA